MQEPAKPSTIAYEGGPDYFDAFHPRSTPPGQPPPRDACEPKPAPTTIPAPRRRGRCPNCGEDGCSCFAAPPPGKPGPRRRPEPPRRACVNCGERFVPRYDHEEFCELCGPSFSPSSLETNR